MVITKRRTLAYVAAAAILGVSNLVSAAQAQAGADTKGQSYFR